MNELKSWDVGLQAQSPVALDGLLISVCCECGEWQPASVGMARRELWDTQASHTLLNHPTPVLSSTVNYNSLHHCYSFLLIQSMES